MKKLDVTLVTFEGKKEVESDFRQARARAKHLNETSHGCNAINPENKDTLLSHSQEQNICAYCRKSGHTPTECKI